jgi:hypothetical protein
MYMMKGIPRDTAISICEKIQDEHEKKIYAVGEMQCVACVRSSKGDYERMCFASSKDNRGCQYVNKKYDRGKF